MTERVCTAYGADPIYWADPLEQISMVRTIQNNPRAGLGGDAGNGGNAGLGGADWWH
ncbi:hypothetical protein [Actinobaculum massiliense]|uniref:hypothetical protein n=1 Tax=Actinobaculum massiliense TaxID=202789 RepID=UPI00031C237C|nr:hypothetical protein [Actinobaculum massiliense]MDK8319504.1 hypothetical protein [Actinobaculum massiliense]MDK8567722.1 hypothetical protein [Actinobaculum massiliense]